MRFRLLGTLEVVNDDGEFLEIPAPKRRELLAVLLLASGRTVSVHELVDALWDSEPPAAARESLQAHVSRLRTALGDGRIETVHAGYRLRLGPDELDTQLAETEVAQARSAAANGRIGEARDLYQQALDRWRGEPLAEFAERTFAAPEIGRLDELKATAVEGRIDADLALGRHADVIPELEALVAESQYRERLTVQLMLALYRTGRQADALAAYRRLRTRLRDELGVDPSPEVEEMQRRILRQDPALGGPRLGATHGAIGLPASASSIIGRTRELELAIRTLAEHRVLTVTGPGGIGKSRLAVIIAQALLEQNPDGTQFVDLSIVTDPERVMTRIGEVVGGGSQPEDVIGRRRMLLVLDNFEQVLDAAPAVSRLIARCPNLRVIVTSRAPLRIAGERHLEVPPLAPADAASLFVERAALDLASAFPADLVAAIVERLDGLPLALELAAARTKALALGTVRDHLADRLAFLNSGARDAPDRHRTLRETIEWSYRLLNQEAQAAFRNLSVLAAGFDLDAAVVVGGTDVDGIASLVDQSLLRRVGDRYSMLETIREFAAGQTTTEEVSNARDRLLMHYRRLPLQARRAAVGQDRDDPDVFPTGREEDGDSSPEGGVRQDRWFALCAADQDNLRAALEWAHTSGQPEAVIEIFLGVGPYWTSVGIPEEAELWAERALEAARMLRPDQLTEVRLIAIEVAKFSGGYERAIELLAESVADARLRADWRRITDGLDDMAWAYAALERDKEAVQSLEQSREVLDSIDGLPARDRAHLLGTSTEVWLRLDRIADAEEACREFVAVLADMPDWVLWSPWVKLLSGLVDVASGRTGTAQQALEEVVRRSVPAGLRYQLAHALDGLAALAVDHDPIGAARLLGMADNVRAESGLPDYFPRQRARTIESIRAALGNARAAELMAEGRDLPTDRLLEDPVL